MLRAAAKRASGFTMVELLIVVALIAVGSAVASLALRDPAATQLEREADRLSVLLELARTEARAAGVQVLWVPKSLPQEDSDFHFLGLSSNSEMPKRWLDREVVAELPGKLPLLLGPEPLIGAQRVILRLGDQRITLGTDGLSPFTVVIEPPPEGRP